LIQVLNKAVAMIEFNLNTYIAILVENDPKASRKIGGFRPVSGEA